MTFDNLSKVDDESCTPISHIPEDWVFPREWAARAGLWLQPDSEMGLQLHAEAYSILTPA